MKRRFNKTLITCLLSILGWHLHGQAGCSDAQCLVTELDISTGVNQNTGSLYSPGDGDAFWTLISVPASAGSIFVPRPAYVIPSEPIVFGGTSYYNVWAETPGSSWISGQPINNWTTNGGPYVFERCFCICEQGQYTINMNVWVDDNVSIGLYSGSTLVGPIGSATGFAYGSPGTNLSATFSLAPGEYCIRAGLNNTGSTAMGLKIEGSIVGAQLLSAACCSSESSILGVKYNDLNCNGSRDPGEPGLPNWQINLTGSSISLSAITDADGYYAFTGIPPGIYTVAEVWQTGWSPSLPPGGIVSNLDLPGNEVVIIDFGNCEQENCTDNYGVSLIPIGAQNDSCCWTMNYNSTPTQPVYGIEIVALNGVTFADNYSAPIGFIVPNHTSTALTVVPEDLDPLPLMVDNIINFCLENVLASPQYIVINYLDSNYETFCSDTILLDCMPERACLYIVEDSLICDSLGYKYIATVANPPGGFAVGLIKFNIQTPPTGATFNPSPVQYVLTDTLFPGEQMMIMFTIQTSQDLYGDSLCFILSAHDGIEERLCCAEIDTCIAFPLCDPCPYLGADVVPTDSIQADECCFTLLLTDTLTVFPSLITGLNVNIITPGINFSGWNTLPALMAGWSYFPSTPTNSFSWTHSSGLVPDGVNYPLFDFCVEGTTNTDSICVVVQWLTGGGGIVPPSIICTDTIKVFCPTCMAVVNDTLRCVTLPDGTQSYAYTFQFENYSPFLVNAVGFVEHPSSSNNVIPDQLFISPVQPYVPGSGIVDISDPITILIDTSAVDTFCLDLVLRQIIGDSIDITCCYVTHCFELPPCDSLENVFCPDPGQISTEPCPQVFDPVCGCDNQTYSNACVADHAGVWIWTSGPCNPDSLVVWGDEIYLQAAEHSGGGVDVSWELRGQGSFDHFFLLHGLPGETLETIELLPATQGRSDYLHLDQRPVFGVNVYQLVGVDQQGRVVYSNVDEVFVQRDQSAAINITAFPIPARNELYIASSKQGPCTIQVVGPDGRTYSSINVVFSGTPVTMDINRLPDGVFFLKLNYADGEEAQKRFVKAE